MGTPQQPDGIDMVVLDAVISRAGCKWHNTDKVIPWVRHLKMIELGRLDLASGATLTEERAKYAYFTNAYRSESVAIFILKENLPKYENLSLQELAKTDFRLGAELGNTYGEVMNQVVEQMGDQVYHVKANEQNIGKLQRHRIDGYIGYPPYASIVVGQKGLRDKIVMLPKTLQITGDIHFMLSKAANSKETFDRLNNALQAIKDDGTLARIKSHYAEKFGAAFY